MLNPNEMKPFISNSFRCFSLILKHYGETYELKTNIESNRTEPNRTY